MGDPSGGGFQGEFSESMSMRGNWRHAIDETRVPSEVESQGRRKQRDVKWGEEMWRNREAIILVPPLIVRLSRQEKLPGVRCGREDLWEALQNESFLRQVEVERSSSCVSPILLPRYSTSRNGHKKAAFKATIFVDDLFATTWRERRLGTRALKFRRRIDGSLIRASDLPFARSSRWRMDGGRRSIGLKSW